MSGIDRRIWVMAFLTCVFGALVMKEVSLPTPVVLGCAALGLMALLAMGLQHPEVPLYTLVAYLPFSRILVGDFGTRATALNLTNILMGWVLAAYVVKRVSEGRPLFQGTPMNRAIWLFVLLGTVSLMRGGLVYGAEYAETFVVPLKRWLTPIAFYFLALWVVRDARTLKTVAALIMIAITVVALMAIRDYSYVAESSLERSRVGGITEHSNTLGAFFVYYMFLFVGFFLTAPRRLRSWLLLIPFLLCFRGIMVTFSRGAYIACAVAGLTACWFRSKLLWGAAMACLVIALMNPVLLPAGIRYRMSQTVEPSPTAQWDDETAQQFDGSTAGRLEIWRGAIGMIKDHPLWGVGYGAFPYFLARYSRIRFMDAHNTYLLIAAEMGIPTLAVFLLVLGMLAYYGWWLYRHAQDRSLKAIALGFLGGLAGLAMSNMFGTRMDAQEIISYFWILAGLVIRGVLLEREARRRGTQKGERGTGNGERRRGTRNGERGTRNAERVVAVA